MKPTKNLFITKTERLHLRPLTFKDALDLFEIYSDKEAMKYRGNPPFETMAEVRDMIQHTIDQIELKKEFRYAIIENTLNSFIGTIINKIIDLLQCEVGYSLGKKYWNMGYGFEALTAMIKYLDVLGYQSIIATTKKDNMASSKLLIKAGFILNESKTTKELNYFEKDLSKINLKPN